MRSKIVYIFFFILLIIVVTKTFIIIPFTVPTPENKDGLFIFFNTIPKTVYYEKLSYKLSKPKIGDVVITDFYDFLEKKPIKEIGYIEQIVFIKHTPYYSIYSVDPKGGWLSSGPFVDSSFIVGKIFMVKSKDTQSKIIPNENLYSIINKIKNTFQNSKYTPSNNVITSNMWWISKDKLNILVDNAQTIVFILPTSGEQEPYWYTKDVLKLRQQIISVFEDQKFMKNVLNSSKDLYDHSFYDHIEGFENDTTKCIFELNGDIVTYYTDRVHFSADKSKEAIGIYIRCTDNDNFDKTYLLQSKFLKDLNIKDAIISQIIQVGNFAKMNVNYRRTGHYIIAKFINGKWNEVFSGQSIPVCEIVNKYQIPKEIVNSCYDMNMKKWIDNSY